MAARFRVLACDYDHTLAHRGRVAPLTVAALRRLAAAGVRPVLVTGRRLDDLRTVCRALHVFVLVVAENGAVLYDPAADAVEDLAPPPPAAFLAALDAACVPFAAGRVVVASVRPHERAIRATIHRQRLPLRVVFNREAVMVLPTGVGKETGLRAALRRLGVPPQATIGVGDAENDIGLLALAGLGVAVANAVPAVAARADVVTRAANGAGVRELIGRLLRGALVPRRRGRRKARGTSRARGV